MKKNTTHFNADNKRIIGASGRTIYIFIHVLSIQSSSDTEVFLVFHSVRSFHCLFQSLVSTKRTFVTWIDVEGLEGVRKRGKDSAWRNTRRSKWHLVPQFLLTYVLPFFCQQLLSSTQIWSPLHHSDDIFINVIIMKEGKRSASFRRHSLNGRQSKRTGCTSRFTKWTGIWYDCTVLVPFVFSNELLLTTLPLHTTGYKCPALLS